MKDTYSRFSAFTSVLMNCTMVLLFAIFFTSYCTKLPTLSSNMKIVWTSPGKGFKVVRLIPNIDLSPQFVYNVKQIFLYVVAKTKSKEEMVWSKIIKNGDNYKFFEMVQSTYNFEPGTTEPVEYEIRGNIFPYTGQILDLRYGSTVH